MHVIDIIIYYIYQIDDNAFGFHVQHALLACYFCDTMRYTSQPRASVPPFSRPEDGGRGE